MTMITCLRMNWMKTKTDRKKFILVDSINQLNHMDKE